MTRNRWTRRTLAALLLFNTAAVAGLGTAIAAPTAPQFVQAPAQMEAAYVRGVQKELLAHGYRPGPPDGVAGPQTRAAVRAYQRDAGLPVNGIADKRLLDHLKFAQPKVYTFGAPVMGHVLDLQRELAERDYYLGPHDGLGGPATLDALSRFQADAGLPDDDRIDGILVQKVRDAPAEIEAAPQYRAGAPLREEDEFMEFVPQETPEPQREDLPEEQTEEPTEEKPDAETAPDFSDT